MGSEAELLKRYRAVVASQEGFNAARAELAKYLGFVVPAQTPPSLTSEELAKNPWCFTVKVDGLWKVCNGGKRYKVLRALKDGGECTFAELAKRARFTSANSLTMVIHDLSYLAMTKVIQHKPDNKFKITEYGEGVLWTLDELEAGRKPDMSKLVVKPNGYSGPCQIHSNSSKVCTINNEH